VQTDGIPLAASSEHWPLAIFDTTSLRKFRNRACSQRRIPTDGLYTPCHVCMQMLEMGQNGPLGCRILPAFSCCSKYGSSAYPEAQQGYLLSPSNVEPGSFSAVRLKCNQLASNRVLRTYTVSNLFVRKARCYPIQIGHSAAPCFTVEQARF
jgi:hypothetical protein